VCGAPIGSDVFERSWLAAKANEICRSIYKTTKVLSFRCAQAAHSVTYCSSLSLAIVVGVGVLNPSCHDANLHEDPAFTRNLFGLKINQGGGGFRPYSERISFLNCMNNILPLMLYMVPKEGDTKKGLWTSLTDWSGPNSFGDVNKATRWAPFFFNKKSRIV